MSPRIAPDFVLKSDPELSANQTLQFDDLHTGTEYYDDDDDYDNDTDRSSNISSVTWTSPARSPQQPRTCEYPCSICVIEQHQQSQQTPCTDENQPPCTSEENLPPCTSEENRLPCTNENRLPCINENLSLLTSSPNQPIPCMMVIPLQPVTTEVLCSKCRAPIYDTTVSNNSDLVPDSLDVSNRNTNEFETDSLEDARPKYSDSVMHNNSNVDNTESNSLAMDLRHPNAVRSDHTLPPMVPGNMIGTLIPMNDATGRMFWVPSVLQMRNVTDTTTQDPQSQTPGQYCMMVPNYHPMMSTYIPSPISPSVPPGPISPVTTIANFLRTQINALVPCGLLTPEAQVEVLTCFPNYIEIEYMGLTDHPRMVNQVNQTTGAKLVIALHRYPFSSGVQSLRPTRRFGFLINNSV